MSTGDQHGPGAPDADRRGAGMLAPLPLASAAAAPRLSIDPHGASALVIDRLVGALGRENVDLAHLPHLRCRPGTAAEVAEVLRSALLARVYVSCQGAADAMLHLDLTRLQGLSEGADGLSEASLHCEVRAGTTLRALEILLREHRLTLGPLPPAALARTLGAVLAAPRPAEASLGLGRLRDRVLRLSALLPPALSDAPPGVSAAVLPLALSPRRASGPDLKQLLIGSQGRVGVITAAVLQVARRAQEARFAGWLFPSASAAAQALQQALLLHGGGVVADVQLRSAGDLRRTLPAAEARPGAEALALDDSAVALLLRAGAVPELARAVLARAAGWAEAAGARALPEAPVGRLLGVDAAFWAGEEQERGAALLSLTPPHQVALPALSPRSLAERFAAAAAGGAAVVLSGVHQHGAALGTWATPEQAPASQGSSPLWTRLQEHLGAGLLR